MGLCKAQKTDQNSVEATAAYAGKEEA